MQFQMELTDIRRENALAILFLFISCFSLNITVSMTDSIRHISIENRAVQKVMRIQCEM